MQWFRRKSSAAIRTAVAGKLAETTRRRTALLVPLEPRIMFDGAIAATVEAAPADPAQTDAGSNIIAVDASDIGTVGGVDLFEPAADSPPVAMDAGEIGTVWGVDLLEPAAVISSAPAETGHAVVFVDSRVQDAGTLLQNIAPDTEVVYLDGTQDGLQQIADYLTSHPGASSVQLLAHGNDGDLWLGNTYLSTANINDHAASLAAIGAGIQQGGDILIYACETGAGELGTSFVNSFAALTGRDVAASDDRTGATGDFDLEISVGSIEAVPALSLAASSSYAHDLAIFTVTNGNDSGAGSLRQAIVDAVNGDTITFSSAMTVTLTSGQLVVNESLTFDGDLDNNGTADVTIDANYTSRVLSITAGTVSIEGLIIREGRVSANGGSYSSPNGAAALGGGISITGGTLTITRSTITANVAAGGGGAGSVTNYGTRYGGGGGGGFNGIGGGNGGAYGAGYPGQAGGGGVGGRGGSYDSNGAAQAGKGGSTVGGAGGSAAGGFVAGGAGGTAGTIGGGGGGAGASEGGTGGAGGRAAGGLFIGTGATVFLSSSTISSNLGAGGGGGGGYQTSGGDGGLGVGGILNEGTLNYQSSTVTFSDNTGGGGAGGDSANTPGANGGSANHLTGGTINSNFSPNTAPVVANLNGDSVSFTEGGSAVLLDAGNNATVTDAESADFNGGNVTVSITANRVSGEDVLAVRNEGSGAGQIGVSGSNITFAGTTIGTFTGGTGTSDLVITLNANATPTTVQALVRNLTYSNSNTTEPSTATRTVRVTVNDGDGGTSTNSDVSVSVVGVNDAPTLTATGGTPTFTENAAAADLFSAVSISTIEAGQTVTALALTVSNLADGSSEVLRIDGTDIALTNGNSGTTATNSVSYTVSVSSGTATVTLSSAGGLSTANAQTLVDGIGYRNDSNTPGTTSRTVTLTSITDSGGTSSGGVDTTSLSIAATVAVVAVNDAPSITAPGSISVTEDVVTALTGISFSDVDAGSASVTVTLSVASGTLAASSGGGVTVGGTATALTLTGSIADINTFIAGSNVAFTTASNATSDVTLTATIDDGGNTGADPGTSGTGSSEAATTTVTLAVTAVNDAPSVTVPATIAVNEDTATALTGISFTDVDAGGSSVTVTLSVGSGAIAATGGGGVTVGGTSTALTLTGSVSNINTFIAGSNVTFTPASDATSNVTLTTSINDGGNTGAGGAQTDSDTTTLQLTAINDAPSITAPGSISVTEDVVTALTGISFSDVDAGSASVTVTLSVASGALSATSGSGVTASGSGTGTLMLSGTIADINAFIAASSVSFLTAQNATSDVTLTVTINDGGNTGADPGVSGTGSTEERSTTVTLTVAAVNDAPVSTVPGAQQVDQDGSLVFSTSNSNSISIADMDASIVQVTLTASNGVITLGGVTGLAFSTGTGSGDGTMTFTGSVTAINTALQGLTFTPTAGYAGAASLQMVVNDQGASGSGGAQSDTDTIDVTVQAAIPAITGVDASTPDGTYKLGDIVTVTVTFDEVVNVNNSGGSPTLQLATGTSGRAATYTGGSGSNVLQFEYVVQSGDNTNDLNYIDAMSLQLNGATIRSNNDVDAVLDLPVVGSPNSLAGQAAIVIDGVLPTATIVVSDTALAVGESSLVTITFSEAVTGLTTADLSVANGTLSGLSSADGGVTWTATFTPNTAMTDTSNLITLDNTGVQDAAGNTGSGTTNSNNYAIDTARPTVTIVVADPALRIGETSLVTITFSEAVSSFSNADLSVTGGTLSTVSSSDGGLTWTATLTPSAALADTAHVITLNNTGVQDAAGNAGVGSTDSNSFVVDTVRPTAIIAVADTALAAGETTQVTITFSETVTDFSNADLSVASGMLSAVSSNDGGVTWTATFTPTADLAAAGNVITLNNAGVQDAAGNAGAGSTDSNNYAIDTVRPTATILIADTALAAGESAQVTITFSEAVSNFSNADLTVANGTLSAVSSNDGGVTWTATFTPSAALTDASNVITLNNAGVTDGFGNAGAGSAESASYAIDTALPTATLALLGAASVDSSTVTYELTLSEAVSGIDAADFVLLGTGSVSAAIQGVEQIDAQTYRITVANVQGEGTLALSLVAAGAGIVDTAGNALIDNVSSAVRNVDTVPAVLQTSEAAPLPPATQLPSVPATTPLIVLPVVMPLGIDVAAGNGAGTPSINSIVAASSLFITPLSEPVADAPRDAAVDRSVALVVPSTGSYLGVATELSGAQLQSLPDLGVRSVSGERFSIALPYDTFTVAAGSGAQVQVQARMTNGQPLPSWLKFDARTGTLTGRPPTGFSGSLDVEISARDTKGNRATSVIHIDVKAERPTAGRAGLDAQFRVARHDMQLDARLLRHLDAAAHERAALDSIY